LLSRERVRQTFREAEGQRAGRLLDGGLAGDGFGEVDGAGGFALVERELLGEGVGHLHFHTAGCGDEVADAGAGLAERLAGDEEAAVRLGQAARVVDDGEAAVAEHLAELRLAGRVDLGGVYRGDLALGDVYGDPRQLSPGQARL